MQDKEQELFQIALGLTSPWKVINITFNIEKKQLHIYLDFNRALSTQQRKWISL